MALAAEDAGLDSVWYGDHLLYRPADGPAKGPWEAWSILAALAEATSRVEIGPLVAATSFHNPAMLAKKAATVDEISAGRLILGLGAGWNEIEYRAYGFPFDRRISRFEEAFTIIRTLLREGFIDFQGTFYEARDCELVPRGPSPTGPPLMVGSIGERMLAITAPHVDAWNAWYDWFANTPEGLRPVLATVDAAERAAGRPAGSIERTVALHVRMEGAVGRPTNEQTAGEIVPIEGPPDVVAERLLEFAAAGVAHVQLVLDPITIASIEGLAPTIEALRKGAGADVTAP